MNSRRKARLKLVGRAGRACFGPQWQSEVSRYTGVSIRTVQRWVAGSHDIPDGVMEDLEGLLFQRIGEVEAIAMAFQNERRNPTPETEEA